MSVPDAQRVQPIAELFTGAATALWATTYSIDIALFNEFLLARLGDPPLNIAVLADHRRLSVSLQRMPAERADTLTAVNRRWLLRGVRPDGQAFHPKAYLAVTGSRATLLVGSGNLSPDGLDEGREVFTTFRSGTPVGDAAIATWRTWMRSLVQFVGDVTLAERFKDLENRFPAQPATEPEVVSPLLHNLDTPIASQLAAAVAETSDPVDELLLAAPFYDDDAAAVGSLLDRLAPARVHLFVTGSTSVNGDRLATRLVGSGTKVTVAAYEPDRFVHAKLIGVIAGTTAWLLSGSANLSRAALSCTLGDNGNVELAVLAPLAPDEVRAVFVPPGFSVLERSVDSLVSLSFRSNPEPGLPAVRLVTAAEVGGGRVEVVTEPSAQAGWMLDDLIDRQLLTIDNADRAVTVGPVAGRLVQIVDANGQVLSNRVVVDDPMALAATLTVGAARPGTDRPPELAAADLDTPLARALVWLHRNLVMDVSERVTAAATGGVAASEADDQANDDLWERLEREQLARDPRSSTYGRLWNSHALSGSEPIIELLEALGSRAPAERANLGSHSFLALVLDSRSDYGEVDAGDVKHGLGWKASTRIRVRARNVLRRWAAAQTDPRLVWVNPLAPAGNFAMIVGALARLRLDRVRDPDRVELTDVDMDELWYRWLRPFAGTGEGDGWLDQLDDSGRALVDDQLPGGLPETVAALCCLAIRPGKGQRERIVALQPILTAALSHGLLEPTDLTARYLSAVTGRATTCAEVDDQLLHAIEFIDDALWCARVADELALDELELRAPPEAATPEVRLDVRGIISPLLDPRVPRLLVAVRHYRHCDGVVLFAADSSWRLAFASGQTITYLPDVNAKPRYSTVELTSGQLEWLTGSAAALADLFSAKEQVA